MLILKKNKMKEENSFTNDDANVASFASATNATNAINFKENCTIIRTASECIKDAINCQPIIPLFGNCWQTNQVAFLVGDTGIGKSILAISIANSIAQGEPIADEFPTIKEGQTILYYDFELSDKQFAKRFSNLDLSNNLKRVIVNPKNYEETFSIKQIESDIERTKSKFIIIDNISAISLKTTADADTSILIMKKLKQLQIEKGVSILVLAHTPKIPLGVSLNLNHLAGSKHLSNFSDSVFFISRSKLDKNYRYIKQVKSRDSEESEYVSIFNLLTEEGKLKFEFIDEDFEENHLLELTNSNINYNNKAKIQTAISLRTEGKTMEDIAKSMEVNKSTVSRWLKKE